MITRNQMDVRATRTSVSRLLPNGTESVSSSNATLSVRTKSNLDRLTLAHLEVLVQTAREMGAAPDTVVNFGTATGDWAAESSLVQATFNPTAVYTDQEG